MAIKEINKKERKKREKKKKNRKEIPTKLENLRFNRSIYGVYFIDIYIYGYIYSKKIFF